MAPPRRGQQIVQLVTHRRSPQVPRDADPFMEHTPKQVEGAKVLHNAVTAFLAGELGREAAKYFVPDYKNPRVVAVEVARIGRVVDAVVLRRVHHRFEPARAAVDHFGVNPELVDEVEARAEQDHRRRKADQEQRQTEQE